MVPLLYQISETAVQNIRRYVESGGTLLMTFFSGIVDSDDQIRLGGYPAPFRDMLGLWVEEFSPLMEGETSSIETADRHQFKCDFWGEVIHVTDAEVLARFRQDDLAGSPAFTYHRFGKGHAFYLGTRLDKDGLSWLMDCLYARAELQPVLTTPQGIEAIRRTNGKQSWFFLLNHTSQEIGIALPGKGTDLLTGEAIQKSLVLPAKGVAIVQLAEKHDSAQ